MESHEVNRECKVTKPLVIFPGGRSTYESEYSRKPRLSVSPMCYCPFRKITKHKVDFHHQTFHHYWLAARWMVPATHIKWALWSYNKAINIIVGPTKIMFMCQRFTCLIKWGLVITDLDPSTSFSSLANLDPTFSFNQWYFVD